MSNVSRTISYLKRNGIQKTLTAVLERGDAGGMDEAQRRALAYSGREEKPFSGEVGAQPVRFSILVPAYETEEAYLRPMIESVLSQTYSNLQLVLADASVSDRVERVMATYSDNRLLYHRLSKNEGISENTNEALSLADGDYIGLLDHDDVLERDALYHIAEKIRADDCDMVYTDEDKLVGENTFFEPNFKLDFNLDYLLTNNYICHFTVIRTSIARKLGFRSRYDGAQDYDLFLRTVLWIEKNRTEGGRQAFPTTYMQQRIGHVPKVLYHWRAHEKSTADNPESKRYAYEAGKACLESFMKEVGWQAEISHTAHLGFYEVSYQPDIFAVRSDVAAVGTFVARGGRITRGPMVDGTELFVGMRPFYSGYLHRAALCLTAEELPEETQIRRETETGGKLVYLPPRQYRIFSETFGNHNE